MPGPFWKYFRDRRNLPTAREGLGEEPDTVIRAAAEWSPRVFESHCVPHPRAAAMAGWGVLAVLMRRDRSGVDGVVG